MAKKNDRLSAHFSQNKMTAGYWKSLGLGGKAPRFRVEGTSEAKALEAANERFDEQLDGVKNGTHKGVLNLGKPLEILQAAGIKSDGIELAKEVLEKKLKQHGLTTEDLKGLAKAIQTPLMVYEWGTKSKSTVIITELTTADGRKITVALRGENKSGNLEVNEIASIHGKAAERFLSEMENAKEGGLPAALRYVDKEKALDWLGLSTLSTSQGLNSAAKVIEEFENPKSSEKKAADFGTIGVSKIIFMAPGPDTPYKIAIVRYLV